MANTIHSLTEKNILVALISLFRDNGKHMTAAQIRQNIPAYLDFQPSEDDLDRITAVLESYSEDLTAENADQDPSAAMMNIFTDSGDGIYPLNISDDIDLQILNPCDLPAGLHASALPAARFQDMAVDNSSERLNPSSAAELETFDSFTKTAAIHNPTSPHSTDLKSLEKNLNDASSSVQEAEERAASLKVRDSAGSDQSAARFSDSSAEKARQQISEAYQKRMDAFQLRVNELQKALNAALHEKEQAQSQADSSGMDAYKLEQDIQLAVDSKEETIRQYRISAEENQKHIDELQKALAAAKESLENARAKALASQQEMNSVRDKADAYYAYGSEKISDLQDQLDESQGNLAQSRSRMQEAEKISQEYAAHIRHLQDELNQTKVGFAKMSDRFEAAGKENSQLRSDLEDSAQAKDQMSLTYQQDLQKYQDRIDDLQKSLAGFSAQADRLKDNVDSLNADKAEMYKAYRQNIDSYCSEIRSLQEDLRSSQDQLAEAADRAQANDQQTRALQEQTSAFKTRLCDLEDRLNAALKALEAAQAQVQASDDETQSLKQKITNLNAGKEQMIHAYSQDKEAWKNRLDQLQKALTQATMQLAGARKHADVSQAQAEDLKENLASLLNSRKKMLDAHQKEINLFKNQICVLKKAAADSKENANTANASAQASRQDNERLKNQMDQWQKQIAQLMESGRNSTSTFRLIQE